MSKQNVDDYLQQGIHGLKETKPDERRRYLGTLRERIIVALTQKQLRENGIYPEVEALMKDHSKAHLYLNGNMDYSYLSKYIKIAKKHKLDYTLVTNKDYNTEIGLVLAHDYAIDKADIYIKKQQEKKQEPKKGKTGKSKKSLFSIFANVFRK